MFISFLRALYRRKAHRGIGAADQMQLSSMDPQQVAELGWIQEGLGDPVGAERFARHALSLSPNTPLAHELLARLALPGMPYLNFLKQIHALVRSATFVEIGVFEGESLTLLEPDTDAIGIESCAGDSLSVNRRTRVFAQSSNGPAFHRQRRPQVPPV